jgi:hypothetical protein
VKVESRPLSRADYNDQKLKDQIELINKAGDSSLSPKLAITLSKAG